MLTVQDKKELVVKFGTNEKDTGNVGVQIAILTTEINLLNDHLKLHPKDKHTKRGLLVKIGHRKSLSTYYAKRNPAKYAELIKALGLRK